MSTHSLHLKLNPAVDIVYRETSSYGRMEFALSLLPRMTDVDGLRLIGQVWSDCDDLFVHYDALKGLLGTRGPIRELMNGSELLEYDRLPLQVTVYRGAGPRNREGASWSLSRDVAAQFPMLNRYHSERPTIYTAEVVKDHILAVKSDRGEKEVITFSARIVAEEPLPPGHPYRR